MFPKRHWLAIGIYVFMLVSSAFIPLIFHFKFNTDIITAISYTNIVGFITVLIILYFVMQKDFTAERLANPISFKSLFGWLIGGLLLAWLAQLTAVMIELTVFDIQPGSENTQIIVEMSRLNPAFLFIPAVIGPIIEEIIFRQIIFGNLYKKMNFFLAAVISSLIFGVFHMELTHLLIYTAMGLVFAYLYVKTKRIIVPILVHMLMNAIVVTSQLLIDPEKLEEIERQLSLIIFGGLL